MPELNAKILIVFGDETVHESQSTLMERERFRILFHSGSAKIGSSTRMERLLMAEDTRIEPSKYTILVVDDEELLRNLIVSFLSTLGHSCVTAVDGFEALEKMHGTKMDAVITGIKMPKMDGIILTREISTKYPRLPVMVMTAFDEEYSAGVAISVGAREFIKKPFSFDEFAIRLHKMIGESKTLRRSGSGNDIDEDTQKSRNELEPLKQRKSKVEFDEEILRFINEIETLRRTGSGNDIDKDTQKSRNELEPLKRKKSKVEFDEEVLEFIKEIETQSRMKREREADGNLEKLEDDELEKSLKKS